MTLQEYVDSRIRRTGLVPLGWYKSRGGPLHVEETPDVALCGDDRNENVVGTGPARVMLRRMAGCNKCETASIEEEE